MPCGAGGAAFTLSHGGVNLYVMALALLCPPRRQHADDHDNTMKATYEADDDIDIDITAAATTVNPIAHQRAIEVVEGQGPDYQEPGGKWWQGKRRPKIQDSSIWEDTVTAEL